MARIEDDFADLWPDDGRPELHNAHVYAWEGFDVLVGTPTVEISYAPCIYHGKMSEWEDHCLLLDHHESHGSYRHFVLCGDCGATGPTERTQSKALARWNNNRVERVQHGTH